MRLRFCVLPLLCCAGCVLVACGSKRPPAAVLDEGDEAGVTGVTPAPGDGSTPIDAGPAPVCTEIRDASPRGGCSCPYSYGMIITDLPCGFALCVDATRTAAICDYDGQLRILHNVDFADCPLDGGALPLCGDVSDGG